MTTVTDEDHREAVRQVARELGARGFRLMALGSTVLLLRTGRLGMTKDVDLHPFPVSDFSDYFEAAQEVAEALDGHAILEQDGASITLNITIRGTTVPVELIEGTDEWISPEVLEDAVRTAEAAGDVLVPSWEHFVAMKAEAHFDRVGLEKQKYLADLVLVRERLERVGVVLRRRELERVIRMRHMRKHADMLATVFRVLEGRIA